MAFVYGLLILAIAGPGWCNSQDPAEEFRQRIDEYMLLRSKALQGIVPLKPDSDAQELFAKRLAVRNALVIARPHATQGQIFTLAVTGYIKSAIEDIMKGKAGALRRDAILEVDNPYAEGIPVSVRVNEPYPDYAPLSFMPPKLLKRLPPLPKQLGYRCVGPHLILLDRGARQIVDFIPNALEESVEKSVPSTSGARR